jgi:hypothetical protein
MLRRGDNPELSKKLLKLLIRTLCWVPLAIDANSINGRDRVKKRRCAGNEYVANWKAHMNRPHS